MMRYFLHQILAYKWLSIENNIPLFNS